MGAWIKQNPLLAIIAFLGIAAAIAAICSICWVTPRFILAGLILIIVALTLQHNNAWNRATICGLATAILSFAAGISFFSKAEWQWTAGFIALALILFISAFDGGWAGIAGLLGDGIKKLPAPLIAVCVGVLLVGVGYAINKLVDRDLGVIVSTGGWVTILATVTIAALTGKKKAA